jgi:hypothetical protein
MATELSDVDFLYKEKYIDNLVDVATRLHPTLNMMERKGGFNGRAEHHSVKYGNPQGIGSTVALAQAAIRETKGADFEYTRKFRFGILRLNGDAMAASEGRDGALMDLLSMAADAMLSELGDAAGFDLMAGSGNGIRGQRSSISGNVITLTGAHTARNFKVGMLLGASDNADGSSPKVGTSHVTAVDIANNKITLDDATDIGSFGDADYLFRTGDPAKCFTGMEQFIPLSAPVLSSDSFRTVDRGVYPELLAGVRLADTGYLPEDAAGYVATLIQATSGKRPTHCALNPIVFHGVARRANAKREYLKGSSADIGFEAITVWTSAGPLKMYADPDVPMNRGRVHTMKDWVWRHLEDWIHVIKKDGLYSMRLTDDDGVEIRHKSAGDTLCKDPAGQGVFEVAA